MKITKKQIEQIIREEYKSVKEGLVPKEKVAKAAQQLGYALVGQPPAAAAVRDALASVYPDAAKALYSAYNTAQGEADMMYSSDYDDDDYDSFDGGEPYDTAAEADLNEKKKK